MALVAQLRDGERELKERRKVQQACLAPVRKLPLEILSTIFKMYCGDGVVDISQKRCPPLRLSAVCKVWRDTMLGMHSLWNAFEIPYIHGVETRVILTRLRAFLDYSGDLPLQHCVRYDLNTLRGRSNKRTRPLELLLEHAHRWTDIRFVPSYSRVSDDQREMLRKLEGRQLSRLRKINGDVGVLAACNTIGILTGLTSLRSVTMHGALHHLERMTGTLDLPWEQIEELDTLLPCEYALAYLQRCPNLVAWSYQDSSLRAESEVHPPASSIVLPRLQKLSIHIKLSADTAILHSITTPALEELSLLFSPRINSDWDHLSVSGFTSLLGRSSCHLRRLFLIYAPRGILDALYGPALQGLTNLGIRADNDAPLTKAFIGALCIAHTDGTPRLLPFLENLEFGEEPQGFKASTLVTMAEARRAMGRPLKRFLLDAALMGMSDFDFGWTYEIEGQMCQVVDEVEWVGTPVSPV
ncbi:hypothetical protein EV715DRAFT_296294 [Schizophyllum commune]